MDQFDMHPILPHKPSFKLQFEVVGKFGYKIAGLIAFLHYCAENKEDYTGTLENLSYETRISLATLKRCLKKLRDLGILETKFLRKNKRDRTMTYFINYHTLADEVLGQEQ